MTSYKIEQSEKAPVMGLVDETSIDRINMLKQTVNDAKPGLCGERALTWTKYFKNKENREKHMYVQIAEALSLVLFEKSITIYPDELLVGNYSSYRVGGSPQPELSGILTLLEAFSIHKRKVNPLQISKEDSRNLFSILPFWALHGMLSKIYRKEPFKRIKFWHKQLQGKYYLINEIGGISHLAPDYEKLINIGTDGIIKEALFMQERCDAGSDEWQFLESVKISAKGLANFGQRYSDLASKMAADENDPDRIDELLTISETCKRVPQKGASSFREALQSMLFGQIAVILESLDNSVCPGRMDHYLYPFYKSDLEKGVIDREGAKELLACFSIKMCELIPAFSKFVTQYYGGLTNFQTVIVGGVDREGHDSTNELSYIFLELMDELRMRQPNFQARINSGSPQKYLDKIYEILASGSSSPAIYNDDVIVEALVKAGYKTEDARDYTAIGCVEPGCQGKSFASTDAAVCNVPLLVEMALNQGRAFGSIIRMGAKTKLAGSMRSIEDVKEAFKKQLEFQLGSLVEEIKEVERVNRDCHPTPLTSMLIDGCIENGKCTTGGGAVYNYSGIQCVGPADAGDALYAIDQLVFKKKVLSMPELVQVLKSNIHDDRVHAIMLNLPKFGNDDPEADMWTIYVVDQFEKTLSSLGKNTRGGDYVMGLYSVTAHRSFGLRTGALPHGRKKGESFASGIAPVNGMDRKGPTSLLNSINKIDFLKAKNGTNFNVKFDSAFLKRTSGIKAVQALMQTYFKRGGMQAQVNSIDPAQLEEARNNPDSNPTLLVRVSGYSAYFTDLSPDMQDEIIKRTYQSCS